MLTRKIEKKLLEWRNRLGHNPLIVKGCRQCGKTFSVLQFARANYEHVVYLNFFENPDYASAFAGSLVVDDIVMYLSAILGPSAVFVPGKTCIVLDEIQECARARSALKFFKIDGRYDVIGTGSLLGISGYKDQSASIPVGYETTLEMHPLDFEEFLWANGISTDVIERVRHRIVACQPVEDVLHRRLRDLLLRYVIVGGMPAVVNEFVETHSIPNVVGMQQDIINGYRDDMVKYAPNADKSKIRECFDSIPGQLGRENKKFQYSYIKKGSRASNYAGSLQWIEDAGIICRSYSVSITELPLEGNAELGIFKVYMADIGLFVGMLEPGTQAAILSGKMYGYKGAIYENLVADFLSKAGRKLYYFHKDSGLEVDFVVSVGGECVLLECKSTTGNTKSAKTLLKHPEKYHVKHVIKLGDYNVGYADGVLTLPLYAGMFVSQDTIAEALFKIG